jgi:hypothetical protein
MASGRLISNSAMALVEGSYSKEKAKLQDEKQNLQIRKM